MVDLSKKEDWATANARKASKAYRDAGLKARMTVSRQRHDSYVTVTVRNDAERELFDSVRARLRSEGLDYSYRVA
ncbi:hypothetical protein [Ferrimonas marina]|uniref:Uncharacterized protein n=1 Tax=Ferrimonas marina TaxID=299255 RepID=A0A1M5TPD3_9GAMM|nr:hypothetical protein [Ferrimonas marina]SHH52675.1 hypothetical protein SAMN02745129_2229 [Ferrimonas marina]